jgi:hypothetical protein
LLNIIIFNLFGKGCAFEKSVAKTAFEKSVAKTAFEKSVQTLGTFFAKGPIF